MPKFKVGDVIYNMFGEYTIIHIDTRGYKVTNNITHNDGLIHYVDEDRWTLVINNNKFCSVIESNNIESCPRCKTELIEKPSFGLGGEIIKKCPQCNWC